MERPSVIKNYNPYRFLIIFYMVGLAGHLIPFTRKFMLILTPVALLISGITILVPFIQNKHWKLLIFIILCGIAGYIAEITGVNSGMLFGTYSYGDTLGPEFFGVPLTMILNWIIVFTGSVSLSQMYFKNIFLFALSSAVLSVILDFVMEPVAISFKYWTWGSNHIPLTNYLTWGVLIFIFSFIFALLKLSVKTKLPAFLFVIYLIYFFILRISIYLDIL